jgi:cytochrome c oxidase subunit 2
MPIVVEVVEQDKYNAWIAEQKKKVAAASAVATAAADPAKQWTVDELKTQGEKVYTSTCVACHQANGQGIPGTFPGLSGSKIATGDKAAHLAIVLNGKPGTAMQPFKQLSDVEIAAVVTYERNSWDNKTGDMVTPAEVKAARK